MTDMTQALAQSKATVERLEGQLFRATQAGEPDYIIEAIRNQLTDSLRQYREVRA